MFEATQQHPLWWSLNILEMLGMKSSYKYWNRLGVLDLSSNGLDRDTLVQQCIGEGILDVDMKRKICLIGTVNMGLDEQSSEEQSFHFPLSHPRSTQ